MTKMFSRSQASIRWVVAAVLALSAAPLAAHDMWIEPTSFAANAGKIIGLRLRVGQDFLGDPIPRDPALIEEFVSVDSSGRKPVYGHDGADPAGLVSLTQPGLLTIGYQSRPRPIVLPAPTFNQYLREEGLDGIAALRAQRNQTNADAREVFLRCAKSLVNSGAASKAEVDRVLGFTLELVAGKNPYTMSVGDDLPVSLTYEGHALAGALVVAMNRANPAAKIMSRTDDKGHITLHLSQEGIWMIKAVHMVPAATAVNADWASFWASLTFELKRATASQAAGK